MKGVHKCPAGPLVKSYKDLLIEWEECEEVWRDSTAKSFHIQYIDSLEKPFLKTSMAMTDINDIINKIKKELSE